MVRNGRENCFNPNISYAPKHVEEHQILFLTLLVNKDVEAWEICGKSEYDSSDGISKRGSM